MIPSLIALREQMDKLRGQIRTWRENDQAGYDQAISLLCEAENLFTLALLASSPVPQEKPDYVSLLHQAKVRVEASTLYKRFINGTPLENDIAVWMADFASEQSASPALPRDPEKDASRCFKCGHAPHKGFCYNMASDNDCQCVNLPFAPPASPDAFPPQDLRERLAALCHEQWSGWMKHLFSKGRSQSTSNNTDAGGFYLLAEWRQRWVRQMSTPYAELSEEEKNSDREEADRILYALGLSTGRAETKAPEPEAPTQRYDLRDDDIR